MVDLESGVLIGLTGGEGGGECNGMSLVCFG